MNVVDFSDKIYKGLRKLILEIELQILGSCLLYSLMTLVKQNFRILAIKIAKCV